MPFPFRRAFSTTVGTKFLIGLTGLGLFVYMLLHLAGNLLVLLGRDTFNEYSHFLISNPLIVPIEIGLLVVFLLHIYKASTNWIGNQAARPVAYARKERAGHTSRKSLSSSTMIGSGLLVALFVLIHVKQFRFGTFYLIDEATGVRDLYRTEVELFQQPVWVVVYVIATLLVGLHLWHGMASAFQSLGLDHPRYTRRLVGASIAFGVLIGGGLAFIPIWMYLTH
ncbi:MAG TPA: succinate dehydrogenase cytochrome b subunit [Vicinamibacterales bacterium]|nr:succinate dehydrogenase cytochrome b subunit [Vicinamibacterales bacterium]